MLHLAPCPKAYAVDQDKAVRPEETLARVRAQLDALPQAILARTERIDNGRLDIPVFLSVCGEDAKQIMPVRKQMGKGASPAQAEASALMELMERYAFFSYWERLPGACSASWDEAEALFKEELMPLEDLVAACKESLTPEAARRVMNLRRWTFVPAALLGERAGEHVRRYVPLDLFRQLGEFNGSSAGNTPVESILQGACELVERHVCCLADREQPELPTIDTSPGSLADPLLAELLEKFRNCGIKVVLKDFSLGMPVPTVAALAWDPATFPARSEIVFTAGTATAPAKAAVRALTEVAQLAGDFNSAACYEASGLPKYAVLEQTAWLRNGPVVSLDSLPSAETDDMLDELANLVAGLKQQGFNYYVVDITNPATQVPAHYGIVPGFAFRERDKNASLGLFAGRIICEEADPETTEAALAVLGEVYPGGHFIPFFRGMSALYAGDGAAARAFFAHAEPLQPGNDAKALAAFYSGYSHTLEQDWAAALPALDRAALLCPDMKEYLNLRGVCLFKLERYAEAAENFRTVLERLDKGSAMDIMNLGMCCDRLGDHEEARRCLKTALSLDPGLEAARRRLEELERAE